MRRIGFLLGLLILLTGWTATAGADPPRPGTTDSGLNESEEATLWSKQPTDAYVSTETYRDAYGENRTTIHQIANGTDLTFTEPPSTAKQWTQYAHGEFSPGGHQTSVHPPTATTEDSTYIKDAHATMFAISPSTKAHLEPGERRFYIAPDGHALGTVDYRVEVPPTRRVGNRTISYRLVDHEISSVRLYADDTRIETAGGTHRPALEYDTLGDNETLTLEADIEATIERRVSGGGSTLLHDSVQVSDDVDVDVYDLEAFAHYAEYPDGETGVSVSQTEPWRGYSLNAEETVTVRGIWRFFTARETAWDELVHASESGRERVESTAIPVYVHGYPSKLGPRSKPEYGGPEILETWGDTRETPAEALPENVTVDVVESAYQPTTGMAIRSHHLDRNEMTVHGIVHGTEANVTESDHSPRDVRNSSLSATIVETNETGITVLLELEDEETGSPIDLEDDGRVYPIIGAEETGHIDIAGERIETNSSGQAVVFISEPGTYTARYEPESWIKAYPAYGGDSATIRWHPLTTVGGWFEVLLRFGLVMLPFVVALYAGRKLGSLFHWRRL